MSRAPIAVAFVLVCACNHGIARARGPVGAADGRVPSSSPAVGVVMPPPPRPLLPVPSPPTEAELAAFHNVVEDLDVLQMPTCRRAGLATTACRDPMSYLTTNERQQRVWLPFLANLGGGFVGVGADQAYAFVAAARSEWAWLLDYDPQVITLHRLVQALIREADTPDAFVSFFTRSQEATTRARLTRLFADRAGGDDVLALFEQKRPRLHAHYRRQLIDDASDHGWLNDAARYAYVRTLVLQGRVHVVAGNLLTDKAMPSIGAAARALGVAVRVYYPSNAEEMWRFTPQYRVNVLGLPFDDRSIVLRTLFNKRGRWDDVRGYWHYVVHEGLDAQRMLGDERWTTSHGLMRRRRPTTVPILSALGFSGALAGASPCLSKTGNCSPDAGRQIAP
jgi:hypothetical protein